MDPDDVADYLSQLETEYDANILIARDFGSRAWNLPGPHSDRDVGFVFTQEPIAYVGVGKYKQNIDRNIEGNTFMGWNLKRFAHLLAKSNPSTIEFLNSNIRYVKGSDQWAKLTGYVNHAFKPIALMGHYHSLAKANYEKYIASGNKATVKRNLYVARALLYKQWIGETHQLPPLDFPAFLDEHLPVEHEYHSGTLDVTGSVRAYVEEKKNGNGKKEIGNPLQEWIQAELEAGPDPEQNDVRGIEDAVINDHIQRVMAEL